MVEVQDFLDGGYLQLAPATQPDVKNLAYPPTCRSRSEYVLKAIKKDLT